MALQGSLQSAHADRPPADTAFPSARSRGRSGAGSLLCPGRNAWRVEQAHRAAVLIDGAAYFPAVREALKKARRSIFIVGWDIDSRCRLVGRDCEANDGLPLPFAEFLGALVRERPDLTVHVLLWDYSVVYALEREFSPTMALHWNTPRQVRLCLDDALPVGSSHHQKIIVVDDTLAFSGGLDLTIRRWDTPEHKLDNPDRVDPWGTPYRPFHDVQALVDGPAARALAELVRERWANASCDAPSGIEPAGDPWPDSVAPDFREVAVGISRTVPLGAGDAEVREVESLFLDSIGSAERTIYIENQFLTCTPIAERLAATLRARPRLEAVMVAPQNYTSWIETHTMRNGRIRFRRALEEAGVADRARLLYPEVREGERVTDTMIHSKVCIIDDRLLRIGSANLNNRSMGADTECDLTFEAREPAQREAILRIRDTLLGEHCGASAAEIAAALAQTGSLIRTAEETTRNGHRLRPIDDGEPDPEEFVATIEEIADPPRPLPAAIGGSQWRAWFAHVPLATLGKIALAVAALIALPLIWQYTPLAALADPETARRGLAATMDSGWTPLIVVTVYVVAGLVAFPVVVLIAVTAATFGPLPGLAYAAMGCLASAFVTYVIGASLGRDMLQALLGPRLDRIRRRIVDQGVLAVAIIRLVPVAPFTLVNLVAGASQIRLQDYLAGTILGMAPGLLVMSVLGHQIFQILTRPTFANIAIVGVAIVAWIAVSVGVQMLASRLRRT